MRPMNTYAEPLLYIEQHLGRVKPAASAGQVSVTDKAKKDVFGIPVTFLSFGPLEYLRILR